jgi:hypothetical protein
MAASTLTLPAGRATRTAEPPQPAPRVPSTHPAGRCTGRRTLALLLGAASLALGGTAAAFWATSGGGAGTGATGTTTPVTLSPGTAAAQVFPGGDTAVVLSVTNPNPGSVRIGSLALDPSRGTNGFGVDAGHAACGLGALSFATQTNDGAGWTLFGGQTLAVTLPHALSMATSAGNACQGASFTVYLAAAA